jgi:uncharacterized protein with GYD domain
MAYFLYQAAYTSESWANQMKHPKRREDALRPVIEKLGGSLEAFWYAFGEYDVIAICKMPDSVSASAFSLAASAGGAVKSIKTTPLISSDEMIASLRKSVECGYKPPGK